MGRNRFNAPRAPLPGRSPLFSWGRRLLTLGLLFLVLFAGLVAFWALPKARTQAAGNPNPVIPPPSWLHPRTPAGAPLTFPSHNVTPDPTYHFTPQSHSWPVSMRPATLKLTASAAHFLSNDGRLEVSVAAGTFDTTTLSAVGGSITLTITQTLPGSGGLRDEHIFFGTYELRLLDSNGKPVSVLALLHPLTLAYHLLPSQAELVWYGQQVYAILHDGNPALLPGAAPTAASQPATTSRLLVASPDASGLIYRVSTNLTTGAGLSSSLTPAASSVTFGTQAPQALWGTPQTSQVDLNSGGLSYTYPLALPPGPGGLLPALALTYSSGAVNESHNLQATAPWVGEGWNLSLGSISWSQENVTPGGTNHLENVWQFNDPGGISGQLIPPNTSVSTIAPYSPALGSLGTTTVWSTSPYNHARILEVPSANTTYPCFRAYFPSGIMEEFGCNDAIGSDQSFKDSSGNWNRYRWDLDLIVDRYGNQIHFTYQRIWDPTHSWIQDAVLSDVQYDDPTCHQQTACATWNPKVDIHFDASTIVQHLLNTPCAGWKNTQYRCDAPVTVSGGLPVPHVLNAYVLNDVKVQVQGNVLHEYVFSYTQGGPQTITDPATGQQESISGYFGLNEIQEEGTGSTLLNAPVLTMNYAQVPLHYIDEWRSATPANNCGPDTWIPGYTVGNCVLWSRTYHALFLSTLDNGRGWNETITWSEGHNNTHGVDSGAIEEPTTCSPANSTSTNRCGQADDRTWSHYVVTGVQSHVNSETSTWGYKYWMQQGLSDNSPSSICDDCHQGYSWGNQNDNDYADYYNGQFESFYRVQVTQPDGSFQLHLYATTTGWGLAESSFTCYVTPATCSVAPYFTNAGSVPATALAGHEFIAYDFDAGGNEQAVHTWTNIPNCKPTGFAVSGGGSPNNPGDQYLISQLDQNNPVVACDPRTTQEDRYTVDGLFTIPTEDNYATDARVVHSSTTYSYDSDNQGVSAFDYGNLSNVDSSGNDLGGQHIVSHTTYYPNSNAGGGVYLTSLPAIVQTRDGSGTPFACSQSIYGSNSSAAAAPTLPGIAQAQAYTIAGSGGCTGTSNLIATQHTYDTIGNVITAIDADSHLGCASGSSQYSACAVYDSATYDTHLTSATNARTQATSYSYDSTSAGGFGQWLTGVSDPNGQATSYQYDALGRLSAVIRPGDSTGSPSVSYSYTNTCVSLSSSAPCLELDSATRFSVGGPTSTMKQWYDGLGNLVETQTPSPTGGQTIVTYAVFYNDATHGKQVVTSLPYAIATPSGYVAPDLSRARSVTGYDSQGRALGSISYSDATTIVLRSDLSYHVAQGVSGFSSENSSAYEQITTLDAYQHQSISYRDALGRTRYEQLFSGTASPYSVVRSVKYSYDVLGDTTQTQTYDSSAMLQASYNAVFDALGRRTGFNDADLGSCSTTPLPPGCASSSDTAWHFVYDADGNLVQQSDPRNQQTYSSYDLLDRPLCRSTQSNPCSNSPSAVYFYDSYNNSSNSAQSFPSGCTAPGGSYASDPIGHAIAEVFSNSVGSGWRCSGYDARSQLDQSSLSVTADSHTTTQTINLSYNDGGEPLSLVYPDGETVTSQYDVNGLLRSAYFGTPNSPDPVNFLVGQISYSNEGLTSALAFGGSAAKNSTPTPVFSTALAYDGIQRPISNSVTVGGSTLWSQGLTYDNVGNVLQLTTTVPLTGGGSKTDNQTFCYDALNRLVWAGNTGTPAGGDHCGTAPSGTTLSTYQQSYSYDNLDRLTNGPSGSMSYDSTHVHAATITSAFPNQYAAYDAMGNMTCRNVDSTTTHTCSGSSPTGAQMSYDNEGRLVSWSAASGSSATDGFLYDNEGNRVLQRSNDSTGITDIITFDGITETSLHNSTTVTSKYYSVGGQRVAEKVGTTLYYLVNDHLGGIALVLKSDASVQATQLYAPYGTVRYSQGSVPTTYNYTGQRLDSETGLLFYNARYYDAMVGVFTSADSVQGNALGLSAYGYVGGNPETLNDPSGHYVVGPGGQTSYPSTPSAAPQSAGNAAGSGLFAWRFGNPFGGGGSSSTVSGNAFSGGGGGSSTSTLSSCGGMQQSDCLGALWATQQQVNLSVHVSLGGGCLGGGVLGMAMMTVCTPGPGMTVNVSASVVTPLAGCASLVSCLTQNEGVDDSKGAEYDVYGEASGGCALSFTPTTVVATARGEQPIGTMKVGEQVWAYNPTSHKMELEPVLHVWINHDNDLVDLTLTSSTHLPHSSKLTHTNEVIHTNKKHPFLTREKGFLEVGQIKLGMHVLRADGTYGVVTGWQVVPGTRAMYNLEVAHDHTFTVGVGQWVVHNCGGSNGVPVNSNGDPYPSMVDPRTGDPVPFPDGDLQKVPVSDRVPWNNQTRYEFIKAWYDNGYLEPKGGWNGYDIHHILPREYGGTNDFWNLVPIEREFHQKVVTPWWKAFVP